MVLMKRFEILEAEIQKVRLKYTKLTVLTCHNPYGILTNDGSA